MPISGKTYSLFGENSTTQPFYDAIHALTGEMLEWYPGSDEDFLKYIQLLSHNRRSLYRSSRNLSRNSRNLSRSSKNLSRNSKSLIRTAGKSPKNSKLRYILNRAAEDLSMYLEDVEQHIRSVSLPKRLNDRSLLTTREQYYLYMIEFELINRICSGRFRDADFKIALLPYCLKESHTTCKAEPDEIDYRCKECLKTCYINRLGRILQDNGIHPYILSRGRVSHLLKKLHRKHGSLGVLGIACMVELIEGMRLCLKAELPVVGIPLNANRCPRWMNTMHDTSIDLAALHKLLAVPMTGQV